MTDDDRRRATEDRGSLLYGELLPRGVHKALDARHLDAARASSVYDLGCGTGKVALQAFLQFPNLKRVYGVELSLARFHVAERALLALAARDDCDAHVTRREPGSSIEVTSADRTLIVEHGNLMRTRDVGDASVAARKINPCVASTAWRSRRNSRSAIADTFPDAIDATRKKMTPRRSIVMLETEVPADTFGERLLDACKEGCRLLTYLDLRRVWRLPGQPFPFRQLEANRSFADRYPTSWSVQRGHHLFLWVKVLKPGNAGLAFTRGIAAPPPSSPVKRRSRRRDDLAAFGLREGEESAQTVRARYATIFKGAARLLRMMCGIARLFMHLASRSSRARSRLRVFFVWSRRVWRVVNRRGDGGVVFKDAAPAPAPLLLDAIRAGQVVLEDVRAARLAGLRMVARERSAARRVARVWQREVRQPMGNAWFRGPVHLCIRAAF